MCNINWVGKLHYYSLIKASVSVLEFLIGEDPHYNLYLVSVLFRNLTLLKDTILVHIQLTQDKI